MQYSLLAYPHNPAEDEPEGDCEHHQHTARTNGHQGLDHEACVEVDAVQGSDTPERLKQ